MTISQQQWVWTGWSGAPGYTSFYTQGTDPVLMQDALNAQHTLLDTLKSIFTDAIHITAPSSHRVINEVTGNLTDIIPASVVPSPVVGTLTAGKFAAPAGLSINWLTTDAVVSRLRVGRTYLVPIGGENYQPDGTLLDGVKAAAQSAAAAYVTTLGGAAVVWKRPVSHAGGEISEIVAARVNDRVSLLKSRRA